MGAGYEGQVICVVELAWSEVSSEGKRPREVVMYLPSDVSSE